MRTEERVSVSFFVDPDEYAKLVERVRSEDRSVSSLLRRVVHEHLEGEREASHRQLREPAGVRSQP